MDHDILHIPSGDYTILGLLAVPKGCKEYWLKHKTGQTTYVFKDFAKILQYESLIVGDRINIKLTADYSAIDTITIINQHDLPQKNKIYKQTPNS